MNGLAVLFPGTGYTCQRPLLAACAQRYEQMGYEVRRLAFDGVDFDALETLGDALRAVQPLVLAQLADVDVSGYDDVVFVSKSFGTLVAGWLAGHLELSGRMRHLFLTPLAGTLSFLTDGRTVIAAVIGTQDPHLDAQTLAHHCQACGIPCVVVPGVGHRLEAAGQPERNAAIVAEVAALCTGA